MASESKRRRHSFDQGGRTIEDQYRYRTVRETIHADPTQYAGTMPVEPVERWVWQPDGTMRFRKVRYSYGLQNGLDESVENVADQFDNQIESGTTKMDVEIAMEERTISVKNNGKGIPVEVHKITQMYVPVMCFAEVGTSENFDATREEIRAGRHGYGQKVTNVLAEEFIAEGVDTKTHQSWKLVCRDNMKIVKDLKIRKVSESKKGFTKITWRPDFKMFAGVDPASPFTADIVSMFYTRIYELSATTPGLRITVNKKKIGVKDFKTFCQSFLPPLDPKTPWVVPEKKTNLSKKKVSVKKEEHNNNVSDAPFGIKSSPKSHHTTTIVSGSSISFFSDTPIVKKEVDEKRLERPASSSDDEDDNDHNTHDEKKVSPKRILVYDESQNWKVAVAASSSHPDAGGKRQFHCHSYVNCVDTSMGGTHADDVVNKIVNILAEELAKPKYKHQAGTDLLDKRRIKSCLHVFVSCRLVKPVFGSQNKLKLVLPKSEWRGVGGGGNVKDDTDHNGDDDHDCDKKKKKTRKTIKNRNDIGKKNICEWTPSDKFKRDLLRCEDILGALLEEAEDKQNKLDASTDAKQIRTGRGRPNVEKLEDANFAGTKKHAKKCTLFLTEGDSAKAFVLAGLTVIGRDLYGVFPLRGKIKNVSTGSAERVAQNKEIANIKQIVGLSRTAPPTRYGHLCMAADQDTDGSHIKCLVMHWFAKLYPDLCRRGFLSFFITPIITEYPKGGRRNAKGMAARNGVGVGEIDFYSLNDHKKWIEEMGGEDVRAQKYGKPKYRKGLGTTAPEESKKYFCNMKRHQIHVTFNDEKDFEALKMAFSSKGIATRKRLVTEFNPETHEYIDYSRGSVSAYDLIYKELVLFWVYSCKRAIPNIVDGLTLSKEKIIYGMFLRKLFRDESKVSQVAAYIADKMGYVHGETSLADTITGLAMDITGMGVNLLYPSGNFGTRAEGGYDVSASRYIFTRLMDYTTALYTNMEILQRQIEEGQLIEPRVLCSVICPTLLTGCRGVGSAFSTQSPPYSIYDVAANTIRAIDGMPLLPMQPCYLGYTGIICPGKIGFKRHKFKRLTKQAKMNRVISNGRGKSKAKAKAKGKAVTKPKTKKTSIKTKKTKKASDINGDDSDNTDGNNTKRRRHHSSDKEDNNSSDSEDDSDDSLLGKEDEKNYKFKWSLASPEPLVSVMDGTVDMDRQSDGDSEDDHRSESKFQRNRKKRKSKPPKKNKWKDGIFDIGDIESDVERLLKQTKYRHEQITRRLPPWPVKSISAPYNRFVSWGCISRISDTEVRISELPIGVWTSNYRDEILATLREAGEIEDIKEYHGLHMINFVVSFKSKETLDKMENPMATFDLAKPIPATNMHLFDANGILKKYATPEDIIREHVLQTRIFYEMKVKWERARHEIIARIADNKYRYIAYLQDVMKSKIKSDDASFETSEKYLLKLEAMGFDKKSSMDMKKFCQENKMANVPFSKKDDQDDDDDDNEKEEEGETNIDIENEDAKEEKHSPKRRFVILEKEYSYLTNIRTNRLTHDKLEKLRMEALHEKTQAERALLISPETVWKKDILKFLQVYQQYEQDWLEYLREDACKVTGKRKRKHSRKNTHSDSSDDDNRRKDKRSKR